MKITSKSVTSALFFAIVILLTSSTFAINPNDLLNHWNAVVSNNITSVSEIEGRLYVGGDYNISNSHQFGFRLNGNSNQDIVFAVAGTVTTNGMANIKVFNGSAAVSSNVTNTSWFSFMNGGSLQSNSTWPQNNSPVQALTDASNYWKTLPANGTIQAPGSQPAPLKFICPAGQKLAVFSVTDVQSLENSKVQQIEVIPSDSTQTIIINVASIDGNVNWNYGNMVGNFDNEYWRSRIIWNFYTTANNGQLGTVSCCANMKGALIAPNATLTGNSNFDGPVFCKNLQVNSEIHFASSTGWNGNAPGPNPPSITCVESWNGVMPPNSTLCEYSPKYITTTASLTKQPANSKAYLQLYWKVVSPASADTSTNYTSKWIYSDTSVSITGQWPGIQSSDTLVKLKFGMRLLDCDLNQVGSDVVSYVIWNPTVCPAPLPQQADIKIIKTVSRDSVQNGDPLSFTITATNLGPQSASNIRISEQLAAGLLYTGHSVSTGTYSPSTGIWEIPSLSNGQSATLNVNVKTDITSSLNGSISLGAAKDFNLFVLENFSAPSSDVEGRMAVGKNATMSGYSVGDKLPVSNYGTEDVLVVGGNLTYTIGAVYNGNILYGKSTNLPLNSVSIVGGVLHQDSTITFDSAKASLQNLSAKLSAIQTTGSTVYQFGGVFLTGINPGTNIFRVDGSKLSIANDLQIQVPSGSVAIVNVIGDSLNWQGGFEIFGTTPNNILFNFPNTKKLQLHGINVTGSVLAPYADVYFPAGLVTGQFICKNMTGSGQFNFSPFLGNIPVDSNLVNNAYLISSTPVDPNSLNNQDSKSFKVSILGSGNNSGTNVNWQLAQNIPAGMQIQDIITDSNNNLYLAIQGGKILKSSNNGSIWNEVQSNLNVSYVWNLTVNSGNWIFASTEKGLFVSKNAGTSWEAAGLSGKDVRDLCITSNNKMYAGTWGSGVFCSTDSGNSWSQLNNGLDCQAIHALTCIGNTVFCGTFGNGAYKIEPSSNSWQPLNVGFDYIWTLCVTPDNTLIAGTYGGGAYRSTDLGTTWQTAFNGLRSRYIYNLYVDNTGIVYASAWAAGVFVSANQGASWNLAGLAGQGINIVFSGNGQKSNSNRIFAGSTDGKLYFTDSPLSVENSQTVPASFELSQNYPNPFNPTTKIRVSVPMTTKATLSVYNVLGQKIAVLFSGELKGGIHEFDFAAKNLSSGIYFYRIESSVFTATKKMVLTK
ncbi:MAG: choice-of-anchor A family protein [Bacteroidota bacterium]|nr:choice-of-anchor A family protein [Bacteroidota bacterium]